MSDNTDNTTGITEYFKDRESNYSNRRKLKIVSQTPNEIIVDIERLDEKTGEDGTSVNATTFNEIFAQITAAEKGSVVKVKNANGEYESKDIQFDSDPQMQINNEATTRANFDDNLQTQISTNTTNISNIFNSITNITNNTAKLQNTQGGFTAGNSSQATAGGAVGMNTTTTSGFAGGHSATSDWGGAIGVNASTQLGGAVGSDAVSTNGGAIGSYTKTGNGFAGGYSARTTDSAGNGIDAIQLGTGTNSTTKTFQVYNFPLLDAAGNINAARMQHYFTGNVNNPDLITSKKLASNGYIKFKSGLAIQWGRTSRIADYKSLNVTYPSESLFTAIPKVAVSNEYSSDDGTWNSAFYIVEKSISKSGFKIYSRGNRGGGRIINWIAIGY